MRTTRYRRLALAACVMSAQLAMAQLPGVPPVQAGMRATFYSSSASIRGSYQQAVLKPDCDPTVEDCWVDPGTGQRFGQEEVPTAAGQGYVNVDILHLDAQTCVLRFTSYMLDYTTGTLLTAGSQGAVTTGGTCSDFWVDPALLGQMEVQSTGGYRVLKGPYTVGGLTVEAVLISTFGASGSQSSSYDAVTGLLVVGSSRSQGAAVPTISPDGAVGAGAGSTHLSYTQVLGARLMAGLAPVEDLPPHVLGANRLVFDCSITTAAHGLAQMTSPCRAEAHIGRRTNLWAEARSVMYTPDAIGTWSVGESDAVIVASGHGGLYAAPRLLAGLRQGDVLDVDPVTGVRTTVAYVDGSVAAILEESNAERKTFVYDLSSGWLVRQVTEQQNPTGSFTTRIELVAVE